MKVQLKKHFTQLLTAKVLAGVPVAPEPPPPRVRFLRGVLAGVSNDMNSADTLTAELGSQGVTAVRRMGERLFCLTFSAEMTVLPLAVQLWC